MKIVLSRLTDGSAHPLTRSEIKRLVALLPTTWTNPIEAIVLQSSPPDKVSGRHIGFDSLYHRRCYHPNEKARVPEETRGTLKIKLRGLSKSEAARTLLEKLAITGARTRERWWSDIPIKVSKFEEYVDYCLNRFLAEAPSTTP